MNLGIIADATCDLPSSIIERNHLQIIPIEICLKEQQLIDTRQPEKTNLFYQNNRSIDISRWRASAPSADNILSFLKENAIYQCDTLVLIAPSMTLSDTLTRFRESTKRIQAEIDQLRHQAKLKRPCRIRVIESQHGYSGYGLITYQILNLLHERAQSIDQIKRPLENFIQIATTYLLPGRYAATQNLLTEAPFNLSWLNLQKLKLTRSLPCFIIHKSKVAPFGWVKESTSINDFIRLIYDELTRTKLSCHIVNVSYAGRLSELRVIPALKALQAHTEDKGGRIVYSSMSPANATQLGHGALTIAFA